MQRTMTFSVACCAAASSTSMFVAWDPPDTCRGSPITSYCVEVADARASAGSGGRGKHATAWRAAYTGDSTSCRVTKHLTD